jgi:hypothetical protein
MTSAVFFLSVASGFIIGAELAYRRRIAVELTGNLTCFDAAPHARQAGAMIQAKGESFVR